MLTIKRTLITKGSVLLGASIFMVGFVGTLGTLTALGVAQNPSSTPAVAVSDHPAVKKDSKEASNPTPQPSVASRPTAAAASSNMMTPLATSNSTNSSVSPQGSAVTYGTEQTAPSSKNTSTTSTSASSQPISQNTTTSPTQTSTSPTCTTLLPTVNTVLSPISKC